MNSLVTSNSLCLSDSHLFNFQSIYRNEGTKTLIYFGFYWYGAITSKFGLIPKVLSDSFGFAPWNHQTETEIWKIATRQTDSKVEIEFSDTGVGISEDNLKLIFQPFFTTKTSGTGLGLANAKQMIG